MSFWKTECFLPAATAWLLLFFHIILFSFVFITPCMRYLYLVYKQYFLNLNNSFNGCGPSAHQYPVHGLYFIYFFHIYLFPQARRTKPISRLLSPPYWKSKYNHSDKENRKGSLQMTIEPKNSHYQEAKVHITAKIRAKLIY